jgi:hypothetical protein
MVPPWHRENAIVGFDSVVVDVARSLLGKDYFQGNQYFDDCFQWRLPLQYRGLGLTAVSTISFSGYLASGWESSEGFEEAKKISLVKKLPDQDVDISEDDDFKGGAPGRKQQKLLADQVVRERLNR